MSGPSAPAILLRVTLALSLAGCTQSRGTRSPDDADDGTSAVAVADEPALRLPAAPAPATKPEGEDATKPPPWDVDKPSGPTKTVAIDVDEGTWMSLDVSPDGKTIVFDLLGDLYTIPIAGGTAKALTEGVAWDMQPRFSPDGKLVAFTSDRDGGDNIWVIPSGGGTARQVSKETFRLLNSPAWSPDGKYIAAHKHFTAERSLGSGEIWLFHASGGGGVQLTEKPNDQKDVGEPAFSSDGRYVYFSQDTTPGPVFEYNKDPHGGIYSILRLDREEGRIEPFLAGPGGAVRPTPSHDGKSLAYVRRIGLSTALVVHDIATGSERVLDGGLDRDMQETWAIHGVYPTMGWTPKDDALVYWAGGKIRKVDVKTAKSVVVPFKVQSTRTVTEALRFGVEVHPDRFHTKMLRNVEVSPDGKAVVFNALGHIWIRELPTGKARRLTSDRDVFEHDPAWSRDGKRIVYIAWNDRDAASVRVVGRGGGKGRTVSREPGHWLEPTFSPDGETIVARRDTGGGVLTVKHSRNPGIYAMDSGGGPSRLVTRDGIEPHFGAQNDRVFYMASERGPDGASYQLRSIALTKAEPRTHLKGSNVTSYRVSPDGRWIAFTEGFHAFIAPFPATGSKPVDTSSKSEALPLGRVSKAAGDYVHWSGDGRALHWSLGPELFTRKLTDTFAFLEGAPESLPEPTAEGVDIGLDVDSDKPKGQIAITGAKIVTMKGDEVIADGTIVVDGNRIVAVGPRAQVAIPKGAKQIDATGTTIVPGFVDVHAHGPQGRNGITPQRNWLHDAMLAFGVTTVHDPSNDTGEIFAAAELARAGAIVAPRIFSTGTILYGAKAPFKAVIDSLDDARFHLSRMKAVGAFSVKSYNQPRRNQRQQVVAAARELEMMVVPEGGSLFQHNMTMVVDGHTGIEHAIPIGRGYRDVTQLWSGTEVGYTPTIVVGYGGIWGENYWYAHTNVWENERLKTFVPPDNYEPRARRRMLASRGDWNHIEIAKLCKQLLDAGVEIQLGAHGQREGLAVHWELWSFVQGGMTPHEALRAGTLAGARYVGLDRDIGSLEPGKLADLAVIEGDVLGDIRRSEHVRYTMLNGRLYDARTMDELAPTPRKRPPPVWGERARSGYGTADAHADD
jgi:imidazolonepropionase-like amidohydrolase/Tol biopolymer transport system component